MCENCKCKEDDGGKLYAGEKQSMWYPSDYYLNPTISVSNIEPKLHVMGVETDFENGQQLVDYISAIEKENKDLKAIVKSFEKITGMHLEISKV